MLRTKKPHPRPPSGAFRTRKFNGTEAAASIRRWTGLRARLMLFVTLVLVGPLGLIAYLVHDYYEDTKDEVIRDSLGYARSFTDDEFGIGVPIRQLLLTLAQNEDILAHRGERCSQNMKALLATEARYASIGAATPDGIIFCNTADIPSSGPNISDREWFKETLANRDFNRGEYDNRISGKPVLVFAYPAMEKAKSRRSCSPRSIFLG